MKIILSIFLASIFFVSCKKEDEAAGAEYYLRFKANGQALAFEGDANGSPIGSVWAENIPITFSQKQLVVHGFGDAFTNMLMLFNVDSVKTGQTYTLDEVGDGSIKLNMNRKYYTTLPASVNPQYSVIVNIQKHSDGLIRGTFSGKVALQDISGAYEVVTITDGSFNAKMVYRYTGRKLRNARPALSRRTFEVTLCRKFEK